MADERPNFCVLVPGYQEEKHIGATVRGILPFCPKVIVVDDGSSDRTADEAEAAGAQVVRHEVNRGKGVALNTGFRHVLDSGYEFVVTMDADGQHAASDLPAFIEAYRESGLPVVIGSRMGDTSDMPFVRRLTNRFMSWLLSRKMGQRVPDTQSGYRLYRADVIPQVMAESEGYAAESEVLLNLAAAGVKMGSVPIQVIYRDEKSTINPLVDTWRFFRMLRKYDRQTGRRPVEGDRP